MSLERFYRPGQSLEEGTRLTLDGEEAHHALKVMRKKVGEEITLFDGEGREARASIEEVGRRSLELKILEAKAGRSMPPLEVTLAVALPRAGEAADLVRRSGRAGRCRRPARPLSPIRSPCRPCRAQETQREAHQSSAGGLQAKWPQSDAGDSRCSRFGGSPGRRRADGFLWGDCGFGADLASL